MRLLIGGRFLQQQSFKLRNNLAAQRPPPRLRGPAALDEGGQARRAHVGAVRHRVARAEHRNLRRGVGGSGSRGTSLGHETDSNPQPAQLSDAQYVVHANSTRYTQIVDTNTFQQKLRCIARAQVEPASRSSPGGRQQTIKVEGPRCCTDTRACLSTHLVDDGDRSEALPGVVAGHHLPHDDAQREDVECGADATDLGVERLRSPGMEGRNRHRGTGVKWGPDTEE